MGVTEDSGGNYHAKLTERLAAMAVCFAVTQGCPCYRVLDAFFSAGSVFRVCQYVSIPHKQPWVEVRVKAQKNTVGYFPAMPKPASRPGPQARYGDKVCLQECFAPRFIPNGQWFRVR